MKQFYKVTPLFIFLGYIFPHGVSESTANAMENASLMDFVYFGSKHMVTGYDHILFLIGVVFFLTNYLDIFKFITAFTIAHCITLIFATFYGITANAYLIDAIIAFSVIYKGFENLDGFKKYFSINPPNLILMVFIFGLIHGFGLSTKLQEVAVGSNINLSLFQILSFNVGVEFGQIIVLLIIFPLLLMLRGKFFNRISKSSNWGLIIAGIFLLIYQLNGFFRSEDHHNDETHTNQMELENKNANEKKVPSLEDEHDHKDNEDSHPHSHDNNGHHHK